MLYSNNDANSVAFGDIEYISEYANDYFNILNVNPNVKSVLKILRDQDDLMLMEVIS